MAQNKNNNKNGGDCCSFCGAKRTDVEIMFQGDSPVAYWALRPS